MDDITVSNPRATIILDVEDSHGKIAKNLILVGENITIMPGPNGEARASMTIKLPDEFWEELHGG